MDEELKVIIIGLILLVVIMGLMGLVFAALGYTTELSNKQTCTKTAQEMEVKSKYVSGVGCMIKINNKWLPLENYRGTEEIER